MRTPALAAKSSPAKWLALPIPTEAYEIFPGCCRASSMRSWTVRTGRRAFAESAMGALPTKPMGAKSFTLSYGMFLNTLGFTAWLSLIIISV